MKTASKLGEAIQFACVVQQDCKTHCQQFVQELLQLARQHGRLCEIYCNRGFAPREERKKQRIEKRIHTICLELGKGFRAKLNGDPRGYTVKLILPSGRYNTWGGAEDGWGVPQ